MGYKIYLVSPKPIFMAASAFDIFINIHKYANEIILTFISLPNNGVVM